MRKLSIFLAVGLMAVSGACSNDKPDNNGNVGKPANKDNLILVEGGSF